MNREEFKLPDLGEGVHEGQILKVLVSEGDSIREDDPILEVETDKATVEIPSPYEGTIEKIFVRNSQEVHVGEPMMSFLVKGASPKFKEENFHSPPSINLSSQETTPTRKAASPSVRRLARQKGIDINSINGSGPRGRLTRADIEDASKNLNQLEPITPTKTITSITQKSNIEKTSHPINTSIEFEIEGGREDQNEFGKIIRQPITLARKTIAKTMAHAWATIPHVTDTEDADITEIENLRAKMNGQKKQQKIGALPFVIKAATRALEKFPLINASLDEYNGEIIYHRYINISIGVETERGIIAPVLHNLTSVGVSEIASRLNLLIENVRSGQFSNADTKGGTYTISNAGALGGSRYATPIITPPQVAVLSLGRSRWMPWIVDGKIEPRRILPLSHSMDHRLIDGGREIPFLMHLVEHLENPLQFSL